MDDLKNGYKKAALTAAVGGALSLVFMDGFAPARVFGMDLPKALVQAAALGGSSYAADILVPKIVPWIAGGDSQLSKFEGVMVKPVIAGISVYAIETIFSPQTVSGHGGPLSAIMTGAASSVASYYFLDSMGYIKN